MARRARPRPVHPRLALGAACLAAATVLAVARPDPAAATVTHLVGFRATVDGFSSWYGSYSMGPLGTAWCIDHGSRAPDPAYGYVPADLSAVPADIRAAMGWVVAIHGGATDRVTHAGVMLALHDLMGARYPSGHLDVDRLPITRLAGFGGQEAQVLAAARAIKADGLHHRGLRGPLQLTVEAAPVDHDGVVVVTARLLDTAGQGIGGLPVTLTGAGLAGGPATTAADGTVSARVLAGAATTMQAAASVPHLPVDAWAATSTAAQRVARPTLDHLTASAAVEAARGELVVRKVDEEAGAPLAGARLVIRHDAGADGTFDGADDQVVAEVTTTEEPLRLRHLRAGRYEVTEASPPPGYAPLARPVLADVTPGATTEVWLPNRSLPPPSTTTTTTTTTTMPPTTTTAPATTAPSTTAPTTTAPSPTAPPVSVLAASPAVPATSLPRTGADALTLTLLGVGLLLVGGSLLDLAPRGRT